MRCPIALLGEEEGVSGSVCFDAELGQSAVALDSRDGIPR